MSATEVDVIVVGLGPGGEHAALKLAEAGLEVLAIEERLVGGECPYFGCVPSKMMIAASNTIREANRVADFAGQARVSSDWSPVAERIRDEATDNWDDAVAVRRLEDAGVVFVRGRGRLTGSGGVAVEEASYVARRGVVLNTGTAPAAPPIPGLDSVPYWTNREVVRLTELPESLIVLGGGPIGCELAEVFALFGVSVTVVEMAERLVAVEEPEASAVLAAEFARLGIDVWTSAGVTGAGSSGDSVSLEIGGDTLVADRLLVATGRRNNLSNLGLEHVGLDPDARGLEPDERMRIAPGVWAIGDITGKGAFTHVSMYQADVAVRDILGEDGPWADYRAVSRVTFTSPEIASVGLSEEKARAEGLNVTAASGDLGARGWLAREEGVVKLVADSDRGILVGACVAAPAGGEILSMLVAAVHAEIPIATLRSMHFAYPAYYRAIESVLADL